MADSPFREHRVPPEEVQRILKRAAELALVEPSKANAGRALTGAEIEQHLRELGISEDVARRAMEPAPGAVPRAPDGAIRVEREMQIEGMLSPEDFERIAELIAAKMSPLPGRTSAVGNKLTWSPTGLMVEPNVTVHSKDGHTTIRYVETLANRGQMTVGFATLSGFGGLFAGAVGTSAGVAIAKAAELSAASGAPVVFGTGILLGIGAAIGSFFGLKRAVANRATKRAAFADALLAEVALAVKERIEASPIRARVDVPERAASEELDAEAEAEAAEAREAEEAAARTRS
jgi:hypothetical protein